MQEQDRNYAVIAVWCNVSSESERPLDSVIHRSYRKFPEPVPIWEPGWFMFSLNFDATNHDGPQPAVSFVLTRDFILKAPKL